ncbi:hypothetical protein CYPRO_1283 [Cyclonatronum proteinivorum]|uniref:Uncharacterized protein n=1 Tax=Cyclonatronum proteinivorum TaxID=1457365 RepID=A0A345UJ88_9BACT|nr:hypothetical protein CYPRO_1283 [Cyclonatronum proteinivorum]
MWEYTSLLFELVKRDTKIGSACLYRLNRQRIKSPRMFTISIYQTVHTPNPEGIACL